MTAAQEKAADIDRLARMENSISAVSEQLGSLIRITEKNDLDRKAEIKDLWNAMKEQNTLHATSLEKQGEKFAAQQNNGELTWGKLVAAGGFLLSLATATVIVSYTFVNMGFDRVNDRFSHAEANLALIERHVDHESEVRHDEQQRQLDRHRMELDAFNAHVIADARLEGKREAEFLWLRDDAEAIKDDLQIHIEATRKQTSP